MSDVSRTWRKLAAGLALCAAGLLLVSAASTPSNPSPQPLFAAPSLFSIGGHNVGLDGVFSMAQGDFNGDGIPDFASAGFACANGNGKTIAVYLGRGDGTFQSPAEYDLSDPAQPPDAFACPYHITTGRLRGANAAQDLVVVDDGYAQTGISVLLGNGDGTFATPKFVSLPSTPTAAVVGDFNGDGKGDVAVAMFGGSGDQTGLLQTIGILIGHGDGTFDPPQFYQSIENLYGIAAGDFNNDGKLDLLARNPDALALSLGNGDGTFLPGYVVLAEPSTLVSVNPPGPILNGLVSHVVADFDGDGNLDIAAAEDGQRVDVLLGTGTGTFAPPSTYLNSGHQSGSGGGQIAAAQLSDQGHIDLVVTTGFGTTLGILRGNGDGTFQSPQLYPLPQYDDEPIMIADVNRDGHSDIVIGTAEGAFENTNYLTVLLNDGSGNFGTPPPLFPVKSVPGNEPATNAIGIKLADLARSGKLDAVVTDWDTPIEPVANGQFPEPPAIDTTNFTVDTHGTISVLPGNGDGTFQAPQQYFVGGRPIAVETADLTGDGKIDLVVVDAFDNQLSILKGNGDRTYQAAIMIPVGTNPTSLVLGDFDGDGKPDIAVTNLADNTVAVLINQSTAGTISFKAPVNYNVGTYPSGIVAADLNHDGRLDLATVNAGYYFASDDSGKKTTLSVLLGNGDGTFAVATQELWPTDGGDAIAAGDFGRGQIDLAVAHFALGEVMILNGNGDGTFALGPKYTVGAGPESIVLGDFDGDGKNDLAVSGLNDCGIAVLRGNGDATFSQSALKSDDVARPFGYATWGYPAYMAAGDLNGDGKPELVTTHIFEAAIAVLSNTAPALPLPTPSPTPSPAASATPSPTASPTASPAPSASVSPSPTSTPTASPAPTETPSPSPTSTPTPTITPTPSATPTPAQLLNISGRVYTQSGDNVAIAGFIITGNHPKHVVVRGIGPSMRVDGQVVADALQDPVVELHDASDTLVASNDNWQSDQQTQIEATGLAPGDAREAAIERNLPAGRYTAIVNGAGATSGVGLAEVFDIDPGQGGELGNLSVRANVGTGDNVLIDGIIVGGDAAKQFLFRALGPELAQRNVANPLQDPLLELHNANGALLLANDNWRDAPNASDIQATGLAPADDREAAILATLSPGQYTSVLRGVNDMTGVALAEVFKLN